MSKPTTYEHCELAYQTMHDQGEPYRDNSDEVLLWQGSLTQLFEDIGLGISRYTNITKLLVKMGCIEQKHRGGGPVPSEWLVHDTPTLEKYEWAKKKLKYEDSRPDPQEQKLRDINNRLLRLEEFIWGNEAETADA